MGVKQQGASFTFSVSGGTWEYLNIGRLSAPIPVIDDTHLGTTVHRAKLPGDLSDPQIVTLVLQGKPGATWPAKGVLQTGTITGSKATSGGTAENWAGTGFVVDVRSPEFASDTENIQTIEVDWQYDGRTGPARTAGT